MNLYIHVPFCAQRCSYCDFYTQTQLGLRVGYIEALKLELEARKVELLPNEELEHIYFGGGTPSLLSAEELGQIFDCIAQHYSISPEAEITLEANPDDITPAYAEALATLPINRVSMGTQSFQEEDLKFLNRRHNRAQVYEAIELLKAVGITNLSLDLIYGLPNQTEATWRDNLERIIALDIPHISAYHLIYEEGTALTKLRDRGKVSEVSEEDSLLFFSMLIDKLRSAGYEHYEISNFAKDGRYAQLNTGYWLGSRYIGAGPAAHSYDGEVRSHNIADIKEYISSWTKEKRRLFELEQLTDDERRHEYIMTRLRTQWGIKLSEYERLFGKATSQGLRSASERYIRSGELLLNEGTLCLSPSGIFVSDAILLSLFD